jgi:hypothetical protein
MQSSRSYDGRSVARHLDTALPVGGCLLGRTHRTPSGGEEEAWMRVNALHRTGLALRARPSLASLGAGERGRSADRAVDGDSVIQLMSEP